MGETKIPERRRHFRGKARAGRRIRVRYRLIDYKRGLGDAPWLAAETRDIGVGGAFLVGVNLPPRTEIELELDLPERSAPLALTAEVRWRADGTGADPLGVGVQFHDVDIDIMLDLNAYLASFTTEPDGVPALLDAEATEPSNGSHG